MRTGLSLDDLGDLLDQPMAVLATHPQPGITAPIKRMLSLAATPSPAL